MKRKRLFWGLAGILGLLPGAYGQQGTMVVPFDGGVAMAPGHTTQALPYRENYILLPLTSGQVIQADGGQQIIVNKPVPLHPRKKTVIPMSQIQGQVSPTPVVPQGFNGGNVTGYDLRSSRVSQTPYAVPQSVTPHPAPTVSPMPAPRVTPAPAPVPQPTPATPPTFAPEEPSSPLPAPVEVKSEEPKSIVEPPQPEIPQPEVSQPAPPQPMPPVSEPPASQPVPTEPPASPMETSPMETSPMETSPSEAYVPTSTPIPAPELEPEPEPVAVSVPTPPQAVSVPSPRPEPALRPTPVPEPAPVSRFDTPAMSSYRRNGEVLTRKTHTLEYYSNAQPIVVPKPGAARKKPEPSPADETLPDTLPTAEPDSQPATSTPPSGRKV
ncbi:MAG: hypothetical protein Q4D98_14430 [Planctomycetia bacterium]|nr:hypothetical protein [Planctomycetia bacterium]